MSRKIIYDHDAQKALQVGMHILAQAVSITLGPKGKNVILERYGTPQIVNDGITIAKAIELNNTLENMGVVLMRQAALQTNEIVGDGTTTTTVLAYAIVQEGLKSVLAGGNPMLIKKGIEKAVDFIVSKISEYSSPITNLQDLIYIASISAGNNLIIGDMIACAMKKVGREGIISLEEGQSTSTSLEVNDGMSFNAGYMSSGFLSGPMQLEISQDNPLILLTDKKITLIEQEVVPLLEQIAVVGRPLLIIAEDIEKEALSTLVLNKLQGIIDIVAVRIPSFGDRKQALLDDLAVLTNATIVSDNLGLSLSKLSLNMMGSANRIIVSKQTTTIIAQPNQYALRIHCHNIRKQIDLSSNLYEREKLQQRLARLSSGIAIIKLGAATAAELADIKLRFEDAINATKAAIEEGVVPGGGSTFVHLSNLLQSWANSYLLFDELVGAKIVVKALLVPLQIIVQNTGQNGSFIVEQLRNTNFEMGYDADKLRFVNMYAAGIIDPAKVTRLSLQNASSIASAILTTGCVISSSASQSML